MNMRAALYVLGADGCVDAGSDGRLSEWGEDGVGGDLFRDRTDSWMLCLYSDSGFGSRFFGFLAARDRQDDECDEGYCRVDA
jgi:hypothetical protein